MKSESIAVALLIEDIPRYISQFKLLVLSIREYNYNLPIYAITPTLYKLKSNDIQWCVDNMVTYHHVPEAHSICRSGKVHIHSSIISAQACLIASKIVNEEYMIYVDNDTVCLGDIIESLSDQQSLLNVGNITSNQTYIDNKLQGYINKFVKTTKKNITLLKNDTSIKTQWPFSWFVFHPVKSTFWYEWSQYIQECIDIVTDKSILYKYNLSLSVIESAIEIFLAKCLYDNRFTAADTSICRLSLFDTDTNINTLFYNYGGFDQYVYRLIDVGVVNKYILNNNIKYNPGFCDIEHVDPGLYNNRYK